MSILPKFVFLLTTYHVICPSHPIVLACPLIYTFDMIFPGVTVTIVSFSGRVHRLHAQEDTNTDLTVSTFHRIVLEQERDCFYECLYVLLTFGFSHLFQNILSSISTQKY